MSSMLVIYDTKKTISEHRKYKIDEYIPAAMMIYLDILVIFMALLNFIIHLFEIFK